jgi:hypothetical protein
MNGNYITVGIISILAFAKSSGSMGRGRPKKKLRELTKKEEDLFYLPLTIKQLGVILGVSPSMAMKLRNHYDLPRVPKSSFWISSDDLRPEFKDVPYVLIDKETQKKSYELYKKILNAVRFESPKEALILLNEMSDKYPHTRAFAMLRAGPPYTYDVKARINKFNQDEIRRFYPWVDDYFRLRWESILTTAIKKAIYSKYTGDNVNIVRFNNPDIENEVNQKVSDIVEELIAIDGRDTIGFFYNRNKLNLQKEFRLK